MKKAYFVLVADKKYITPTAVTIASVAHNFNKNYSLEFFVISDDIEDKPDLFKVVENKYNLVITCLDAKKHNYVFKKQSRKDFLNTWISFSTYYRLLMFKMLPPYVDLAFYLDSDIIVNSDLSSIYESFNREKLMSAVAEIAPMQDKDGFYSYLKNIPYFDKFCESPTSYPYFNAGFFIANIQLCKKMKIFSQIEKFLNNYQPKLADQDTLNAIFGQLHSSYMDFLDPRYNVFCNANYALTMDKDYFYTKKQMVDSFKKPYVIHYAGCDKPWESTNYYRYHGYWEKYAKLIGAKIVSRSALFARLQFSLFPLFSKRRKLAKKIYSLGKFNPTYFNRLGSLLSKKNILSYLLNFCFNFAVKLFLLMKRICISISVKFVVCKGAHYKYDESFYPLVSVIVPNYNHKKFLKKRLNSVYKQTYKNIEVILLDDCSTDSSIKLLDQYFNKYQSITRKLYNDKNSGGVFHQWKKGIQMAKGDIIWMAESDDWCDKHLLERLVKEFKNPKVNIACATTYAVSKRKLTYSLKSFNRDVPLNWKAPFIEKGSKLLEIGFGWKSLIPNASQIVFRKIDFNELFDNDKWVNMRLAGDWVFYLYLLKNDAYLSYVPDAVSYHNLHGGNTSLQEFDKDYWYKEHLIVYDFINSFFDVSYNVFVNFKYMVASHWILFNGPDFKSFSHSTNFDSYSYNKFNTEVLVLNTSNSNLNDRCYMDMESFTKLDNNFRKIVILNNKKVLENTIVNDKVAYLNISESCLPYVAGIFKTDKIFYSKK